MRSVRLRIVAVSLVLAATGVAGRQLWPARGEADRPVTVGTTDAVTSLDPAGAYDAGSWALFSNVFQSLLTFAPGRAEPEPDAAGDCDFTGSDLRTYRCRLREELTFPSGRYMTAEDVKFSFDRVKRINSRTGPASLFDTLESVAAHGSTVTFHLSDSDATFPFKVATGAGSIVDRTAYPADALREDGAVDGTGPYTLTAYTANEKATLAPNPAYRGAVDGTGQPVTLRYYADSEALEKAWRTGTVDVATRRLPPDLLAGLSPSDPGLRVFESDSFETRNLHLNVRAGSPLHDPGVRQAVSRLIDRDRLAATVHQGTVDPLYSLIPAGLTGHTTSFFDNYPARDARTARAQLVRAGVTLPVPLTYGYRAGPGAGAEEAAEIRRQLEEGGLFEVTVQGYEWTDFQRQWASGRLDLYAVGWIADYPDPDTFAAPLVGSGSPLRTGYASRDVDRLILAGRRHADRGRAADDLRALQETVARDVPLIPLWQRKEYVVTDEAVGGGPYLTDGTGVFRLWRLTWI
ncbi:ABC transporter substrate-binding protein [Streptomyces cinereospinus]|uniref:ABC transporter substrate-binding protein n=1 Tax=Streptomyces cinereospinus TaxID=285561 RepID=A0ABV5MU32_9ACTN